MGRKKISINIEVQDDGGYKLDMSSGFMNGQHNVAETVDSLIIKMTKYVKKELGGSPVSEQ
jgi:hypothetical protein